MFNLTVTNSIKKYIYICIYTKKKVSHSHLHLDGRMRIVVTDLKVLCLEIIDGLHFPEDLQLRERQNLPLKLQVESNKTEGKRKS